MARRIRTAPPLAPRFGIAATRVVLSGRFEADAQGARPSARRDEADVAMTARGDRRDVAAGRETVFDHLRRRFPHQDPGRLAEMLRAREILYADGTAAEGRETFEPGTAIWYHRDLPDPPAGDPAGGLPALPVIFRNDNLLVIDKPHFVASVPNGSYVRTSALARLRHELSLPLLAPAHRLDRATAGVLVFTVRPEARARYQTLFARHEANKTYEAIAPFDAALAGALPLTVRTRIESPRHGRGARSFAGEPNSETQIDRIERFSAAPCLARYTLRPITGRTHQLRLHLAHLGVPILGDPLYPEVLPIVADDSSNPLRLVARLLSFRDPLTGERRTFRSSRILESG